MALIEALASLDVQIQISSASELCLPSAPKYSELVQLLKNIFDASVKCSDKKIGPLSSLTVQNLDSETIWEEVQTRNRPLLRYVKTMSEKIMKDVDEAAALEEEDDDELMEEGLEDEDEDEEDDDDVGGDDYIDDADERADENDPMELSDDDEDFDEDGVDDFDEEPEDEDDEATDGDALKSLGNDDVDFFEALVDEVEEMEERYVNKLQSKEKKSGHRGYVEDDDDDEDELDYEIVEKEMYNDEEDDNESAENAKFSDFFGNKKPVKSKAAPPSRYADEVDEDFRYDNDDADEGDDVNGEGGDVDVEDNYVEADEEDEGGDDSEEIEEDEGKLTSFQKRQKKLMEEIAELEKGIISAKSWEMKGEVKAADRPENSLLGVYVDVERASKPTPIVTQEFTDTLEDMIIKRITDQIFDDVVPKLMDEGQDEAADLPELSQEKSKEGLGEIYEDEFLSRTANVVKNSAQVSAALDEVKGLFHVVCRELDSLSHFHYTPRPVVAEPVVTGLPSISLEEVLPSAENHGSTSAPEQVLEKKSGRAAALLTEEELGRDDRQRLRRASKAVRRKQRKLDESEEKLIAKINPGAGNKYEAKKALEEIRGDKRVVQGRTEGNKGFGKSSDFFSDMQQQAQIDIAAKKEGFVKKQKQAPTNDTGLSKKLKL